MKDQINTIREALTFLDARFGWAPGEAPAIDALRAALDQIEAMTENVEPVAWQRRMKPVWGDRDYMWSPWEECSEGAAKDCWKTPLLHEWAHEARALYTSVHVDQGARIKEIGEADLDPDEGDPVTLWAEIWRLREAVKGPDGYATWQDAATAERILRVRAENKQAAPVAQQYEAGDVASAAAQGFRDGVASVAQQPQAEAVQACGHPMSLLLRSAESNEPLYCEACDDKSGRHDAERRETELLDANRHLQEKIASADALKLHAIEELCQLGYTVKDGELIPPDHLHKLVEAAGHPLTAPQQAESVQYTRADLDRAYSAGLVEGERLAIQQAEATHQYDLAHRLRVHLANRHTLTSPEFKDGLEAILAEYYAAAPEQAEAVPPTHVLVPIDVLQAASESLGNFVSDHGWTDADMQAMDNLDAAIAQQKGQP